MAKRKRTPKHTEVAEYVRHMIRRGRFAVGHAIPTEQELARRFQYSRGTVRRALDTLVNEGLVRRKQGAGHFVARHATTAREALFGLIVPNILNAEILRLAQLFTLRASRKGYRVILCVTSEQPTVERDFLRELHRLKVSGVIKFPTVPELEPDVREKLRSLELPYVIINDFWTDTRQDHHVAFDEIAAVEMAADHLVRLGHKRIGWVDGSDGPRETALAALRNTLSKHALDLPDNRVLLCPPYETPPVEALWKDRTKAPTAIVTPYDGMAVRVIESLPRIGLRVPDNVSLVNLNGHPFYFTSGLELTTTVPPNDVIVSKVLEILTASAGVRAVCHYRFRPRLHVGHTSAPPRRCADKSQG